jgi:DNA-damage-inducible protein J
MDREVKENADRMFRDLGMSLSTAVSVFIRQSLRQGGLPFQVADQYHGEAYLKRLDESIADIRAGKVTEHELIED